jgi:hypothetical protein
MATLRRLLNPLSTRLTDWWCHLGKRSTRGVIVVVPAEEVEDGTYPRHVSQAQEPGGS